VDSWTRCTGHSLQRRKQGPPPDKCCPRARLHLEFSIL
jgi:hypothetical protein